MTASSAHRLRMARLSSIHSRRAEMRAEEARLAAEEARIFHEMAEGMTVDLATGKTRARSSEPEIAPPTQLAQARAARALQQAAHRRRVRP